MFVIFVIGSGCTMTASNWGRSWEEALKAPAKGRLPFSQTWHPHSAGRVYACKRLGTGNEYAVKAGESVSVPLCLCVRVCCLSRPQIVNTKAIGLRERTMASLR